MVTMVITPSQQGCRSRNQPLTLFTLTKDLLCLLVTILLVTSPAAAQQGGERHLDETNMDVITCVKSCADLPNERTPVQGFVVFVAAIVCPSPKVIEIAEGGNNAIFIATQMMHTKNVKFEVRKGTRMHFRAPGCIFERDQGDKTHIFDVNGNLSFHAHLHHSRDLGNTRPDDPHWMLHTSPDANVTTLGGSSLHFSETSVIVVAGPADAHASGHDNVDHQSSASPPFVDERGSELQQKEPRSSTEQSSINGARDNANSGGHSDSGTTDNTNLSCEQHRHHHHHHKQQHQRQHQRQHQHQHQQHQQQPQPQPQPQQHLQHQEDDPPSVPTASSSPTMGLDSDSNPNPPHQQQQQQQQQHPHINNHIDIRNSSPQPPDVPSPSTSAGDTIAATNQGLLPIDDIQNTRASALYTCDQLQASRTPVYGIVVVRDHVICEETRTIEVNQRAFFISKVPDLRFEGLHFRVLEGASLRFGIPTMRLGALEGQSEGIFTVEGHGFLGLAADEYIPFPDDGTDEDAHSLVRAGEGAKLDFEAAVRYTSASMTVVSTPDQDAHQKYSSPAPIPSTEPVASTTGDDNIANSHGAPDTGINLDGDDTGINPHAAPNSGINPHGAPDSGINLDGDDSGIKLDGDDSGTNPHTTPDRGINPDNDDTDTKVNSRRRLPPTHRPPPTRAEIEKFPGQKIHSCDELRSNVTRLEGLLLITGDVVCQEDRLLEITEELIILSEKPVLYLEGVRFHVKQNAALRFAVSTMHVEQLEGVSEAIFTVEPRGYVGLHANEQGPVPQDGSEEDTNTLVHVQPGGEFFFDCRARYTASGMSAVVTPYHQNPRWMRLHVLRRLRRRQQLEKQHQEQQSQERRRQQQQQQQQEEHQEQQQQQEHQDEQQGMAGAGTTPSSPSAQRTVDRLAWRPSYLMVGEELRFPSSMATLDGEHIMTMGVDGSLLLSGRQRYDAFHDEMVQAAENQPWREFDTETFVSGLNPDYNGVDPRADLKVLAAADLAQAMRSIHDRMQRTARPKALENQGEETPDGVAEMDGKPEDFLREGKKKSDVNMDKRGNEDEDEEEKVPRQQPEGTAQAGRGNGSSSGETKGGRTTGNDTEDGGSGTSRRTNNSDESEATAAVATNGPGSPPPAYFGDDIVLQVTKTGDVVVTVGGRIVVEKRNPSTRQADKLDPSGGRGNWLEKQLWKAHPLATLGRIIRRHRPRREGKSSGGSNGINENVSFGYSLHVVEKGFEVQLDGAFVWGWDLDKESPQPSDVGYAFANCEFCWRHPR